MWNFVEMLRRGLALPWIEHGLPDSKSDVLTTVL